MGDKILLNIQLIDGRSDKHLWSKQYRRESSDIFELQQEIAKNIADEIQAIITPEEKERIEKIPTDDLIAYDFFLKGKDLMHEGSGKSLEEAISYLKKAIERDNKFALAYAAAAIAYYYLDIFQAEQKYLFEISSYADKAMLHDPKLAESLVAKALVHMHRKEYAQAVTFLEKALLFNPNSIIAINFLANVYNYYIPNTAKYLEYALKGIKLDITSQDSVSTSINYLRLSDALVQAGFVEESLTYINKSLAYNPNNFYSRWVKIFILFAKDRNLERTRQLLIGELNRDTTQLVMVEEVAKICYLMKDYTCAYQYYERFIKLREAQQLNIFKHEDLKIAIVLSEMGMKEKAEEYVKSFKHLADNEQTIYKHLLLAGYYSYRNDSQKAIEHMKLFSKEDNFKYWMLLFDDDPAVEPIKDLPEFKKAMRDIENKFWASHKKIRVTLEEKDLL
jgi:tetratricopeptide (TPR) repeat protein